MIASTVTVLVDYGGRGTILVMATMTTMVEVKKRFGRRSVRVALSFLNIEKI